MSEIGGKPEVDQGRRDFGLVPANIGHLIA
jgi:hypothetical protein